MILKSISIKNFRNLRDVKLNFEGQVFLFIGNNGQGKTNLVESIFYLSKGKSFRTSDYTHLIHNDVEQSQVKLKFNLEDLDFETESTLNIKSKEFLLNGKKTSSLKIFKKIPLIFFSPESLTSIKEGPELRRNLIDETTVLENEENLSVHFDFKKILKTRNKILRDFIHGKITNIEKDRLLDAIDPLFADLAIQVTTLRKNMLKALEPHLNAVIKEISNDPSVEVSVDYVITDYSNEMNRENFIKYLNNARAQEGKIGYTQSGPQKHDVIFLYNGKDSRFFSSQGQQRTLILAFKFAQIMYHYQVFKYYPILILDDVLSELDRDKRNYLLNFLKRSKIQTFITTTELNNSDEWQGLSVKIFKVDKGNITIL